MIGFAMIILALIMTGIALVCYLGAFMAKDFRLLEYCIVSGEGRGVFYYRLSALFIIGAALYLSYIILSDQFQFAYVFEHSSRNLSMAYKLFTFWSGQEGSFLLWILFHASFGVILARGNHIVAMIAYSVIQMMLLFIIVVKSPFMILGQPQLNGFDLNPALKDLLMILHPPVIFLGYTSVTVLFALAVDSLMGNRHKDWADQALPWALFSWTALGAGILVGGFWAYKLQGWGGYWSWDPVENASLVSWLACGILLHLLLLARILPAAAKVAYPAAMSPFALVMYGVFLTHSGILSDFSVHSFADAGIGGLLGGFVLFVVLGSSGLIARYWPRLPRGDLSQKVGNREFWLIIAAVILAALVIIVFTGISVPMVTIFLGNPQSVNATFYNITMLPVAVLLVLALAVGVVSGWGDDRTDKTLLIRRCWWLAAIASLAMSLAVWNGIHQPLAVAAIGLSGAIPIAHLLISGSKKINWPAGAAHIGVAVAFSGILFSSLASQSLLSTFMAGEGQRVFGMAIIYLGNQRDGERQGFYHIFKLEGPVNIVLRPFTKLDEEGQPAIVEPGIYRGLLADVFLSPVIQAEDRPPDTPPIMTSPQQVNIEIDRKPLINLVWLGGILVTGGTFWAGLVRVRQYRYFAAIRGNLKDNIH